MSQKNQSEIITILNKMKESRIPQNRLDAYTHKLFDRNKASVNKGHLLEELDWENIDKDWLMEHPELLAALYEIAEKEDLELAETGLEEYLANLEKEDRLA